VTGDAFRFTSLAALDKETSSEVRREILRKVTEALTRNGPGSPAENPVVLDELLVTVATAHSTQVRAELATLVSRTSLPISRSANLFANDDIAVAEPILRHSRALSEEQLLNVIADKSQQHMMAVTKRTDIGENVSHALAERGDDAVVTSLLENAQARIGEATYEALAVRAENSAMLHAPFVRRSGVPIDLLNDLYLKVEDELRQEIVQKLDNVSAEELEVAFQKSRKRVSNAFNGGVPDDYQASLKRVNVLQRRNALNAAALVSLLREGKTGRTAFKIAFGKLTDVEFERIDHAIEKPDLDTIALLCRGAGLDRTLFVTLAVSLDGAKLSGADAFGQLYESVSVNAAQRALRFWKVRAAA
jgi:uncharacterized protein (DUF2336 family)